MEPSNKQPWEDRWSASDYSQPWMTDKPPQELIDTVVTGRFVRGAKILDVGCGIGANAAWLARQEFSVLGVDFSEAAINKARQTFGNLPNLRFEAADVCAEHLDLGKFDGLFDRGCLHQIPPKFAVKYAENIARWSAQDAVFLLIHQTQPQDNESVSTAQQTVRSNLGALFRPWFGLKKISAFVMHGHDGGQGDWGMPCLAIWMVRK